MNTRQLIFLFSAFFIAVGAMVIAYIWVQNRLQPTAVPVATQVTTSPRVIEIHEKTVNVLVANRDMRFGSILGEADVRWQPWPEKLALMNYIVQERGDNADTYIGRVLSSGLSPDEPVLRSKLRPPGDRGILSSLLSPGTRAITIPVTATSGVGGFIAPQDRVDIIFTARAKGSSETTSIMLLSDVKVLAVDRDIDPRSGLLRDRPAATTTIEVTPRQSELISLASSVGQLVMSLRPPGQVADGRSGCTQIPPEDAPPGVEVALRGCTMVSESELGLLQGVPDLPAVPLLPQADARLLPDDPEGEGAGAGAEDTVTRLSLPIVIFKGNESPEIIQFEE